MNDDMSQRSVATWFGCGWTFDHYFATNLVLSLFRKKISNRPTFGKVMVEKLIA